MRVIESVGLLAMAGFILMLFCLIPIPAFAQMPSDTTSGPYTHSWHALSLRTGIGMQKSFYMEIGPSLVFNEIDSREGFGNAILYTAFEWVPAPAVYGVKIGGEFGQNLSMAGLEMKWQSDRERNDFVITPKIGIGLGFVNLCYGYNISTNKYPFHSIGKNQFSLTFNITKKYFKGSSK